MKSADCRRCRYESRASLPIIRQAARERWHRRIVPGGCGGLGRVRGRSGRSGRIVFGADALCLGGDRPACASAQSYAAVHEPVSHRASFVHVNCEGCEYDLFESLSPDRLSRFRVVQFATHNYPPHALARTVARYCRVRASLTRTHRLSWGTPFVWERWVRA